MNYRDFNLDDWIGHISGVIEDETTLDGNEMRDLVEFLTTLKQYPTTNNDLGVDCIDRDSAIKALDYDIKCFEFKSGVSKHMDDIAKLLNTIYETQVNNIKALPSVTPIRPKGRWIDHSDEGYVECPKCGSATNCDDNIVDLHFCFSCGAEMDGVEE